MSYLKLRKKNSNQILILVFALAMSIFVFSDDFYALPEGFPNKILNFLCARVKSRLFAPLEV